MVENILITFPYKFCLITDFKILNERNFYDKIKKALDAGVDLIQYRDFNPDISIKIKRCERLRKLTNDFNAGLFINRNFDLFKSIDADGIHLGSDTVSLKKYRETLGKEKFIGISVHNKQEIEYAKKLKPNMLILCPLFKPGSKKESLPPLGEKEFTRLLKLSNIPVMALGGINSSNARIPLDCGAAGIALITGLLKADNIFKEASAIKKQFNRGKN